MYRIFLLIQSRDVQFGVMQCNHHNNDARTGRAGPGLLMNGPERAKLYK